MESLGTVDKAVDLLFQLRASAGPQRATALGRALGTPKSSTHRLLSTLCRRGLVERDEGGCYRPGFALVALGLGVLDAEPLVLASRTILEHHAAAIGETFFLVAARANQLVVLHKAEGSGFLRAAPRVGSTVPTHATAVGKLFLALAPDSIHLEPAPLPSYTPHTLTDPGSLAQSVALARRRAWAASRDEWVAGLSVLAVPVWRAGRMQAALALAAATPRLDSLGELAVLHQLERAAAEIATRLEGGST